ncbi:MAG: hypothetical protein BWY82_02043 [Verrucomicrobia bacterium ADurb.Bin474]|nr:MAG: hypothetical protein BWY82_02043 [Verrucomicrobia bacterium ADurb.Bin474]
MAQTGDVRIRNLDDASGESVRKLKRSGEGNGFRFPFLRLDHPAAETHGFGITRTPNLENVGRSPAVLGNHHRIFVDRNMSVSEIVRIIPRHQGNTVSGFDSDARVVEKPSFHIARMSQMFCRRRRIVSAGKLRRSPKHDRTERRRHGRKSVIGLLLGLEDHVHTPPRFGSAEPVRHPLIAPLSDGVKSGGIHVFLRDTKSVAGIGDVVVPTPRGTIRPGHGEGPVPNSVVGSSLRIIIGGNLTKKTAYLVRPFRNARSKLLGV